jgi:hypothetical protein
LDVLLVAGLVGLEPVAVVVLAQVDEKREEILREGRVLNHARTVAERAVVVPAAGRRDVPRYVDPFAKLRYGERTLV